MNDNLQHTPYDSTDRATFDLNTHPHYTAQHSSRTMLDHHSGLPSPRSDADFAAQPDMLREISMSSAPTRDGEQEHTSADETRARTRPRKSSPHDQIEPPRNEIGKMICNHPQSGAQCQNFVFERKCDWSKHMDKHDRPYKCVDPACTKLRGFTYSGGLLRHQREVHKYGTNKSTFHCPYPYCKRGSGSGFTRKENLKEHMSRVHRPTQGPAHGSPGAFAFEHGMTAIMTPPTLSADLMVDTTTTTTHSPKRKSSELDDDLDHPKNQDDLRKELICLRSSSEDSMQQIAQLRALLQERDTRIDRLEHDLEVLLEQRRGDMQQRLAQEAVNQE